MVFLKLFPRLLIQYSVTDSLIYCTTFWHKLFPAFSTVSKNGRSFSDSSPQFLQFPSPIYLPISPIMIRYTQNFIDHRQGSCMPISGMRPHSIEHKWMFLSESLSHSYLFKDAKLSDHFFQIIHLFIHSFPITRPDKLFSTCVNHCQYIPVIKHITGKLYIPTH